MIELALLLFVGVLAVRLADRRRMQTAAASLAWLVLACAPVAEESPSVTELVAEEPCAVEAAHYLLMTELYNEVFEEAGDDLWIHALNAQGVAREQLYDCLSALPRKPVE